MILYTSRMRPEKRFRASRMRYLRVTPVIPPLPGEDYRYAQAKRVIRRVLCQAFVLSCKGLRAGFRCLKRCAAARRAARTQDTVDTVSG